MAAAPCREGAAGSVSPSSAARCRSAPRCARLIYVSTVAVYGRAAVYQAGAQGVTENYPFQPLPTADYYARSKRAAEQLVQQEAARGGLSAIAIRPNVIYGERDLLFTRRLIANIERRFLPRIGPGT